MAKLITNLNLNELKQKLTLLRPQDVEFEINGYSVVSLVHDDDELYYMGSKITSAKNSISCTYEQLTYFRFETNEHIYKYKIGGDYGK